MKNDRYFLLRILFLNILCIPIYLNNGLASEISLEFQQSSELVVSGRVTSSADGQGIPGVSILVKNTSTGAVTDVDGNYSIVLPNGSQNLVFSSIRSEEHTSELQSRENLV